MATYDYESLKEKYHNFKEPMAVITVNGKDIANSDKNLVVSDIDITLSCGFEANIASFSIYNAFENFNNAYNYDSVKSYIQIGSMVNIALGYFNKALEVFTGIITKVNFSYSSNGDPPGIRITCMDVKGIMMANCYAKSLVAYSYGEAVKEVFQKTAYTKLTEKEVIKNVKVEDTPDKGVYSDNEANDFSIEMENESDYEFVVRAAKRFNFEFFVRGKEVIFRKARSEEEVMMELNPTVGLLDFDIEYDITGLVNKVEVRGMDTAKGKLISSSQKIEGKFSEGNKATALLSDSEKIIVDPTIKSQKDAEDRAKAHAANIAYRFGTFNGLILGTPEIVPGKFIEIKDMGTAISNKFYVTEVRHVIERYAYKTYLIGQAAALL